MGMMQGDRPEVDRQLFALTDKIYAASMNPEVWASVMDEIVDLTGGLCGACAVLKPKTPEQAAFWAASRGTPRGVIEMYARYHRRKDVIRMAIGARPDDIRRRERIRDVTPMKELLRSEIYSDHMLPVGARDLHLIGIGGNRGIVPVTVINVVKPKWNEDTDGIEDYVLTSLAPHLRRAFSIHWQLAEQRSVIGSGLAGFDSIGIGVISIGGALQTVVMNKAAERIMKSGDGLIWRSGRLHAESLEDDAGLARLVGVLSGLAPADAEEPSICVRRKSGARPYVVTALPPVASEGGRGGLVFIKDPEESAVPDADVLMRTYGMTKMEAALCGALVSGKTKKDFGVERGLSENTVKTHLAAVFLKTNTDRQAELVRLVLSSLVVGKASHQGWSAELRSA